MSWNYVEKKYPSIKAFYLAEIHKQEWVDKSIKVLDFSVISNVVYQLLEKQVEGKPVVFVQQILISPEKTETGYKVVGEGSTVDHKVPVKFLKQVTIVDEKVQNWIDKCKADRKKENDQLALLKYYQSLPKGTILEMYNGDRVVFERHYRLKKLAGYLIENGNPSEELLSWKYSSIKQVIKKP